LGALFGAAAGSAKCAIEHIDHPSGHVTYRTTPAGEQLGVQLPPEHQAANAQYQQETGQAAPTSDDGPIPGSLKDSDGSESPVDDATAKTATQGYFGGWG
jgi:hypothetical protein